jgi:hypothetical protein
MNYLNNRDSILKCLFLDLNILKKKWRRCLLEIKQNEKFSDAISYSLHSGNLHRGRQLANGIIFTLKTNDFENLKYSEVVTMNWQYHTSGLNRKFFNEECKMEISQLLNPLFS